MTFLRWRGLTPGIKRIVLSVFVAGLLLLGNEIYFRVSRQEDHRDESLEVIASVSRVAGESQRKGAGGELWGDLREGDDLFEGDSIRTTDQASLRISLKEAGKVLDIEPGTLFVLSKNEQGLLLDVIDGSIFENRFETKKAQRDNASGKENAIALQVKGASQGQVMGISQEDPQTLGDLLQVTSPQQLETAFLNPVEPKPWLISWQSQVPDLMVDVWQGPSPQRLEKNMRIERNNTKNDVQLQLKVGTLFWQLRGISRSDPGVQVVSRIFQTEVIPRYAPTAVSPPPGAMQKITNNEPIQFRWITQDTFSATLIEVFRDGQTKDPVLVEKVARTENGEHTLSLPLPGGVYSWRLKGLPTGENSETVVGPMMPFHVLKKGDQMVTLDWNSETQSEQFYTTERPTLRIAWMVRGQIQPRIYRLTIQQDGVGGVEKELTSEIFWARTLKGSGRFLIGVEGLDEEGDVIGRLKPRWFTMRSVPLISAVELEQGHDLTTDDLGNLRITWKPVEKADHYKLQLSKRDGTVVVIEDTSQTEFQFTDLLPGIYTLEIDAVDSYQRSGERRRPASILVPDPQTLVAPKLKKVEVEQ